tara:strand:+ start:11245 stop:13677 length:2433 start_codon:yes stop_codon:yes gene_type:complete
MIKPNRIYILFITIFLLFAINTNAQNHTVSGYINDRIDQNPINLAEIYNEDGQLLSRSNTTGYFEFLTKKTQIAIIILTKEYQVYKETLSVKHYTSKRILLDPLSIILNEVSINEKKQKLFGLSKMADIVGTSIYAGKKSEVINLEKSNASLGLNNSRQIYNQITGLNIYQNDDAGLQLNIGGRGLDPNRTSNFNTRKNGYDISADVLGYPESYYTPPAEALEKIEIIRGAASLQYGTQFGGLINFITKRPSDKEGNLYTIRTTVGSNGLLNSFNSINGSNQKNSYYSFFNYKKGDGFRENSNFESKNGYIHINKKINSKTNISGEFTILNYLSQQAGGLNDQMFIENPLQSNRSRNWFKVNWLLYNIQLDYKGSENSIHKLNLFALDAERLALGYRSNRVAQEDPMQERDLIYGEFKNYGFEYKALFKNKIKEINTASLLGIKFYKSKNKSTQGPGSANSDADFNFYNEEFPYYKNQSSYTYPNLNTAVFGENIFYINNKVSITPGFRYEYIETKSEGQYSNMLFDNANNPIFDTIVYNTNSNVRDFIIFGLGIAYKVKDHSEIYMNISQNYRSVTFSDISIVNPAFIINPDIEDEKGYTSDIGMRGQVNNTISYDFNCFYLRYNKRIGFIQKMQEDGNIKSERGNIGDARIVGIESLIDFRMHKFLPSQMGGNFFINTAFINSEYISSKENGIKGNNVEFVPRINLKTGLSIKYKSIESSIQLSLLEKQFTDATNAITSNLSGIIGEIPQYEIVDFSLYYIQDKFSIASGVNNLFNKSYFTRRATGYPGPGIIPSPPRNYYITLELHF